MKCLLLVSHGSRREASNEEVRQLAARVRGQAGTHFDRVEAAFLELATPSIPAALQSCIDAGADHIVVLPYFLSRGRHVVSDVPAELAGVRQQNPGVTITLAQHLGAAVEGVSGLLLELAAAAVPPQESQ